MLVHPNTEKSAFRDSVIDWVRLDTTIGGCWGEYQEEVGKITECTMYFDDPQYDIRIQDEVWLMTIRLLSYSDLARQSDDLHRVWIPPVNQEDARCWLIHNGDGYYCKAVGYPEPGVVGIGYVHLFTDQYTAFEVRMRFT